MTSSVAAFFFLLIMQVINLDRPLLGLPQMLALGRGEIQTSVPKGQEKGLDMREGMPWERAVRGSEEFMQGLTGIRTGGLQIFLPGLSHL